ncbi:hypothetical protein QYE76_011946 [Lolium multiflorum]|uniref:Zinc finger-XS domain-containing protein n=1 Tax=Lolium multiflorum TaxID=4521 RepID=A0AAD8U0U9_LOLMU|nr:hypothetical protein QYE76_011946 [Lolium multiflorum]
MCTRVPNHAPIHGGLVSFWPFPPLFVRNPSFDTSPPYATNSKKSKPIATVTVEGSAQPAVVAVADEANGDVLAPAAQADDQGFDPNDPFYRHSRQYRELYGPRECDEFEEEASDNCSEEDSEDIGSDKEDRDPASVFPKDIESLIQHATGVGKGSAHKHKAASKAKHAAFGKFLRDYVKTGLIPLVGPAVGPHVVH